MWFMINSVVLNWQVDYCDVKTEHVNYSKMIFDIFSACPVENWKKNHFSKSDQYNSNSKLSSFFIIHLL